MVIVTTPRWGNNPTVPLTALSDTARFVGQLAPPDAAHDAVTPVAPEGSVLFTEAPSASGRLLFRAVTAYVNGAPPFAEDGPATVICKSACEPGVTACGAIRARAFAAPGADGDAPDEAGVEAGGVTAVGCVVVLRD